MTRPAPDLTPTVPSALGRAAGRAAWIGVLVPFEGGVGYRWESATVLPPLTESQARAMVLAIRRTDHRSRAAFRAFGPNGEVLEA